jgi:hypothetical protein
MIASDDVEHGEDEEPHAAGDENGIEHGILLRGCGKDESRNESRRLMQTNTALAKN